MMTQNESSRRVKGRASGSPLARGLYPRASTAEADPRAKPGAPAAVGSSAGPEEPKVVVVILNWNRGQDTTVCLESVRALRYADYETIVVDN
jgi:hypothetical protein